LRVLIVGGGGREHALAWSATKSPSLERLYVAPGNGGTAALAENVPIAADDVDALYAFAEKNRIDLTVVGPEAPLVAGIVDRFEEAGMRCFGPRRGAARLEGSKVFAKEFMKKYGIPTAEFAVCDEPETAKQQLREMGPPVVIKADGLAAGKGVFVARTTEEADAAIEEVMVQRKFGDSGQRVIVEECLQGEEVSVHSICGGGRAVLFPTSQDHKRAFDGDEGPNTGGMGAYAPVPFVDAEARQVIFDSIIMATLDGMESEGNAFSGVLYAGLMMTPGGPKVLEFNVRFGDPETQVLLPLLKSDLLPLLHQSAGGSPPQEIEFHAGRFAATVVMAADGYPGAYDKGSVIKGTGASDSKDTVVFHAGTHRVGLGRRPGAGDRPCVRGRGNDKLRRGSLARGHWSQGVMINC
jgi:phosphoribosylamine--glycine ligase